MFGWEVVVNIVLVGMSGVGKTSVGRLLARALSAPHVDVDRMVVESSGMSIQEIFEIEGELGFRARELDELRKALSAQGAVVSVGAGAVSHLPSFDAMASARGDSGSGTTCRVVWLDASDGAIARRLSQSRDRPLLSAGLMEGLALQRSRRSGLYASLADDKIECDGKSSHAIAKDIYKRWSGIWMGKYDLIA
jgi:shikimate kinase